MSRDIRLYESNEVWDQPLALGQKNLLQAILDFWPENIKSVLDVGCGDGKLSSQLARQGLARLVGVDSSAEALTRLPFTAVRGDATALPFLDGSFDLVLSTDALEHMADEEENRAWAELFRVAGKAVMVAVPFREELLDATARCDECSGLYHVNWHQRNYDLPDLKRRAGAGWQSVLTVLAGEPWSQVLPPDVHFRRKILNQWGAWRSAICPHCGAKCSHDTGLEPLSDGWAQALAAPLYQALQQRRYCRSHSEILMLFVREGVDLQITQPSSPKAISQPACMIDFKAQEAVTNLEPFCQIASYVSLSKGWCAQFPAYDQQPALEISRVPGTHGDVHLLLEDALGCLFDGCVLPHGQMSAKINLTRSVVAGYYGVLAHCKQADTIASLALGTGPSVLHLRPNSKDVCYWLDIESKVFVQVPRPLWFDPDTLMHPLQVRPDSQEIFTTIGSCLDALLPKTAELLVLREQSAQQQSQAIQLQNVTAERDALLSRIKEADQFAVQVENLTAELLALRERSTQQERQLVQLQNVTAERDALLSRIKEADQFAVQVENLTAELLALRERSIQQERQLVQLQNVTAERDTLLSRIKEADQFAVQVENLTAELLALRERSTQQERQLVQLQNVTAERDALLSRIKEADQFAVQVENLTAELLALRERSVQQERQVVQLQNVTAERDALLIRAKEADQFSVQVENLTAERLALRERSVQQERQVVQLQNITAERDALLIRAKEADQFAVQVENLTAELLTLRERSVQQERQVVQLQNVIAERDALLIRAMKADQFAVQVENLTAELLTLRERSVQQERQVVQLQNVTAERDALLIRAKEADQFAVQLQNVTAERDALLIRAKEADQLAVQVENLTAKLMVRVQSPTAERDT